MRQFTLPLKPDMQTVDISVVSAQPTMTEAIKLAQQVAGLQDKEVCAALKIDIGQWARIKGGASFFPQDKLNRFCDLCENEAPLVWWAMSRGYELKPLESEMQRQIRLLREENERVASENVLLRGLVVGRAA